MNDVEYRIVEHDRRLGLSGGRNLLRDVSEPWCGLRRGAAYQTAAVEHRVHRRSGRHAHVAGQPANQQFPDLAGAQCGFSRLVSMISRSIWSGNWLA